MLIFDPERLLEIVELVCFGGNPIPVGSVLLARRADDDKLGRLSFGDAFIVSRDISSSSIEPSELERG